MNRDIKQHKAKGHALSVFSLKIGEWKNLFTENEYKLMIAKSLNYCAFNEYPRKHDDFNVEIVGYLITAQQVCLVLSMEPANVNKMLMFFYKMIKDEIRLGLDNPMACRNKKRTGDSSSTETLYMNLFEKHPLNNYLLVKLITGQKTELGYYNPRLALMKDRIHDYNFCSALDYAGAAGPVKVTKMIWPLN